MKTITGQFWFGTEQRMQWLPSPIAPVELTPRSSIIVNQYLNGGIGVVGGAGAQGYKLEWSQGTPRSAYDAVSAYWQKAYGTGDIFFILPNMTGTGTNLFPSWFANPTAASGFNAPILRKDNNFVMVSPSVNANSINTLPTRCAVYEIKETGAAQSVKVKIPVPPTWKLLVETWGSDIMATTSDGVTGVAGGVYQFADSGFVDFWVGSDSKKGDAVLYGAKASLIPSHDNFSTIDKWSPGLGHNGCAFTTPIFSTLQTSVLGDNAGFSLVLEEVSGWEV